MSMLSDDQLPASVRESALVRARTLIDVAARPASRRERTTRRNLRRLFSDPRAVDVTITLTDEVIRFHTPESTRSALQEAAGAASSKGFGTLNLVGLRALAQASRLSAPGAQRIVATKVRSLTQNLILDADPRELTKQFAQHASEGLRLNVNVLGEAVLGEGEADERLARVREIIARPDVNYVSVKLSAIVSQLLAIDHDGSLLRVAEKLRPLYRDAAAHDTFVNLDMEEFRDLRLTLDAFMTVLDEPEFLSLHAGIVLQAYLPESHAALEELITFSKRRHREGGGVLKVRLVKGANLAMEHVEAELHGWQSAPYATKADVDASYLRLVDVALRAEHAKSLRVGVASHNLFHVAWAIELAKYRGVHEQLDIEMLEGMANAEALALTRSGQPVLLYAPITRRDDFASAVAYLVRRLDENTAPENYLRAALFIADDPAIYREQEDRFVRALEDRHAVDVTSRRRGNEISTAHFDNEPDGDPTSLTYVERVRSSLAEVGSARSAVIDTLRHLEGDGPYRVGGRPRSQRRLSPLVSVPRRDHRPGRPGTRVREFGLCCLARARRRGSPGHSAARRRRHVRSPRANDRRDGARWRQDRGRGRPRSERRHRLRALLRESRARRRRLDPRGGRPRGAAVELSLRHSRRRSARRAGGGQRRRARSPRPRPWPSPSALVNQLWEAGVPRDVLQMIPTRDDETGRHLVTHVGVSAVILTGSFETAKSSRPGSRRCACSPRPAARTPWSSRRAPTSTSR